MHNVWKIVLVGSVMVNVFAVWGFFHYVRYGGSPLGELKRILKGTTQQRRPCLPYTEENAETLRQMAQGQLPPGRVVFLGASITARWDLGQHLPDLQTINRGVGGQLVPGMMVRFKRDVLDLKPAAVVIKFCSLNIRPDIPRSVLQDAMMMMTELAQNHGITPIVCTIIPAGKPEAHIGDFRVVDSLRLFNDWVRTFAGENSLDLIDLAGAVQDENGFLPRRLSTDPVHVNEKGYKLLSAAARPVIERALGRK